MWLFLHPPVSQSKTFKIIHHISAINHFHADGRHDFLTISKIKDEWNLKTK